MRHAPSLILLALLLAAPMASAHIEGFSQARSIIVGPYLVYLQPAPDTIFANTTLTMSAQIADNATGIAAKGIKASLVVGGPEGFNKRSEMREDRQGMLSASVILPHRGNYSFRVLVTDANGTHAGDTELEAYPDLPLRIKAADSGQDVYVGEPASLEFEVSNRSATRPYAPFGSMSVRMEHWSDDHSRMLSAEEGTLAPVGANRWILNHTFPELGMYHLKFASEDGGFTYSDVPILHLYATQKPAGLPSEEPADDVRNLLPGPAPLLVLLALAGLALARRR